MAPIPSLLLLLDLDVEKLVTDELKNTLKNIENIKPNNADGWGPDNEQINKILPDKDVSIILETEKDKNQKREMGNVERNH